uniref:Putative secreted protein n=1 Tax=Ixodes ricinus TaxID=34613 RepID=A0A6B0UEJ5_IXORI
MSHTRCTPTFILAWFSVFVVPATIAADGSVSTSTCHCAAKEGLCNHSLALLQMIAFLKKEGCREAPLEVTCTELPQQWRRPRGSQINPGSVGDQKCHE